MKILFSIVLSAFALSASALNWTNYPVLKAPAPTDTFLFGTHTTNDQITASDLSWWTWTNNAATLAGSNYTTVARVASSNFLNAAQVATQIAASNLVSSTMLSSSNYSTAVIYAGASNITAATSLLISIGHTMSNTNYTPSVSWEGGAGLLYYVTLKTTTSFTLNVAAPLTDAFTWSVIYSP